MERYRGTIEKMGPVDISGIVDWLSAIPLSAWPMQDRLDKNYIYPAMVSNLAWHQFGEKVEPLVTSIMSDLPANVWNNHWLLSVVVPGQHIAEHDDVMTSTWRLRIHVPLVTNPGAQMGYRDENGQLCWYHMDPGFAYRVNTEVPHALRNDGDSARIHFFFDVREGQEE